VRRRRRFFQHDPRFTYLRFTLCDLFPYKWKCADRGTYIMFYYGTKSQWGSPLSAKVLFFDKHYNSIAKTHDNHFHPLDFGDDEQVRRTLRGILNNA
jgi:hypothetical protein